MVALNAFEDQCMKLVSEFDNYSMRLMIIWFDRDIGHHVIPYKL